MIYSGASISVRFIDDGIASLCFSDSDKTINTLNYATLQELKAAIQALNQESELLGVLLTSDKPHFIVGADINEFLPTFSQPAHIIKQWIEETHSIFNALEDLNVPTISVVSGYALGGGCECILATDYRVADHSAKIGLPEVTLGIIPGFGGTVRMPRVIGADNAIELISNGKAIAAHRALKLGLLDAVVDPAQLLPSAIKMLKTAINDKFDWRAKRKQKLEPLSLNNIESQMSFSTAKTIVRQQAGLHYPAPLEAVITIEAAATQWREGAIAIETAHFIPLAQSATANALISIYQMDKETKRQAKMRLSANNDTPFLTCAVIGAGIMGGGISYQSASKGVPVTLRDISNPALKQGIDEVKNLLLKQHQRQKLSADKMLDIFSLIQPSVTQDGISDADIIIEAVVENAEIKQAVLAEAEQKVSHETIITSNTSTIPITQLSQSLQRPEQFCGMHFFNPVHRMPLVEIIRGEKTSDHTLARVVAYSLNIGKLPIVVNDCPGFLVNRVLFPYLFAFCQLVENGSDVNTIDTVMEKQFGWPMGPAYLLDVIGIDTALHAAEVMSRSYPDRMALSSKNILYQLFHHQWLGQKNGQGFYQYKKDKRGKPIKVANPELNTLLNTPPANTSNSDPSFIINRLMIPFINELARCLEEGIVANAAQADIAMIYGLGFPAFRGGPLHYVDQLGLENYIQQAEALTEYGPLYHLPTIIKQRASQQNGFHSTTITESSE